ncbi:DUF1080 domain-containing protein [Bacillus aquiflavi]|uniref:glycerophosphodiester phosphodiesterase family protein n=1 Tax=Bacillus aquiflavi TaxID=2672567 RepID=UPI001CA84662|nr:glycerophosphodiester phosphodiesterase family protein [Bacillus aquiflavi]UAC48047.1 DUF1080 domain-containing protein [Bacillus aquiflavi]
MYKIKKMAPFVLAASVTMGIFSFPSFFESNSVHAASQETILIEENFDRVENQTLPNGWKLTQGHGEVQDGKLLLTSPSTSKPSRVLVPLPSNTGDYVFEADMTFLSAVEDTRWASLMYRIQSGDYPYYQFAIRRGTTALNGVEFAIRNENNKWEVPEKTFFSEPFQFDKSYHLKVIAKGNRVQQYVNNQLIIDTDLASKWTEGDIGFQATGVTVQFDNVKVTTQTEELPPLEESSAFLPKEPETNILNAPTVISEATSIEMIDQLVDKGVSSIILPVQQKNNGEIVVENKALSEILQKIKRKVIPIIQIEDQAVIQPLTKVLQNASIQDIQVISSKPELIKKFKEMIPTARGGVVYTRNALNKHDLENLAKDLHKNKSKVAVIPQKLLSAEIVHYLHSRTISVWGMSEQTEKDAHKLIHAGVDGIISKDPTTTLLAYNQYPENTFVQRPIVAAHRGVPSLAPENTMVGYWKAYGLGADLIETDVRMTKDGHLVIMHDNTVNRTTNGTGAVSSLTLEEIRQLDAGIKFNSTFAGKKVPTFREFLQAFKGKDVVLLIELKDVGIEEKVVEEIEQLGMTNQVLIQSFNLSSIQKIHELKQEIGIGFLYSTGVPGTKEGKLKNAQQMLNYAATLNATLNASYGSLSSEFITYMRQRGMTSLHWTFRNEQALEDQLLKGMIGPITDYTQWLTDAPIRLETPIKKRNLKVGKTATIHAKAFVSYREDKKENIETTLFVIGDQNAVQIEGNTIKAVSPGKVNVFFKHTFSMLGKEWNLVAEPIEVNISE